MHINPYSSFQQSPAFDVSLLNPNVRTHEGFSSLVSYHKLARDDLADLNAYLMADLDRCQEAISSAITTGYRAFLNENRRSGMDADLEFCHPNGALRHDFFLDVIGLQEMAYNVVDNAYHDIETDQGRFFATNPTSFGHTEPKMLSDVFRDKRHPDQIIHNRVACDTVIAISWRPICNHCAKLLLGMARREAQVEDEWQRLPDNVWMISATYLRNQIIHPIERYVKNELLIGAGKNLVLNQLIEAFSIDYQDHNSNFPQVGAIWGPIMLPVELTEAELDDRFDELLNMLYRIWYLRGWYLDMENTQAQLGGNILKLLRNS